MKKTNIFLMSGGLVLFFIFILVVFSFYATIKVQKEIDTARPLQQERQTAIMPDSHQLRQTISRRPADYGIDEFTVYNKPKTQGECDAYMLKNIKELKAKTPPEAWAKIREKTIIDAKRRQEGINEMDKQIKEYAEILKKNPSDKHAKKRLENMMMLKGMVNAFAQVE